MSSLPTQVAEVIQTAHINRHPSPRHDLNPSTAASTKEPVYLSPSSSPSPEHSRRYEDELDDIDDDEEIPLSVLVRPHEVPRRRRTPEFPPMPDLRFEQSYLHSIASAETWGRVAWITVRDQIMMPLAQGVLYNLAIVGWQSWNRNAQMSGSSAGARLRRWWYGVNNWPLPTRAKAKGW
ncbi:hypothetical protein E0Z10_g3440 [Xylaria hypoxylon]|uniref:DUF1770 domain-containing protein n=1 Tax=Xylaria hypoxylon TaxID=37992 RepID=A0A4Z0Z1C8_9PEZI|nr:hypothetical protein E0Z10_g3440 [Xylaria hypoxylon]